MVDEQSLRAYVRLRLSAGIGPITFRRLVDAFGDVQSILSNVNRWRQVDGVGPKAVAAVGAVTDDQVQEEIELARQSGASIVCPADDEYPKALKTIYDYPPLLYVRGKLLQADATAIGVVGARHCTHYGMEQAERFAQLLARAGFTIVSGGARGIDTAAHRGALTGGGRTIAVMGCGLAYTYPPENRGLFEEIISSGRGAVVSELPMRTAVLAGNFPTRNRIISGMSIGLLVVEAARKSGSLITASVAGEQGRAIFAVPGRVDSPTSQGVNELIRTGATLVQNLDDILEELPEVGKKLGPEIPPAPLWRPVLEGDEKVLIDHLTVDGIGLDELVNRVSMPAGRVLSAMTMLVIKGLVAQSAGNVFRLKKG
ncbi:MAG: DNA-protecting protein DprA [Planctomycetes bacterium]|nr:DNA-protecting protein DprA [Planctomycetota bacterium]